MTVASLGTACHRSWTSSSHGSHHRTLCFQCGFAHAQMFPSSTVLCVLLTRSTCSETGCYQVGLGAILLLLTLPAQYVSLSRHYACTSLISGTTFVKLLYLSYLTETVKKKHSKLSGALHRIKILNRASFFLAESEQVKSLFLRLVFFVISWIFISISCHIWECQVHCVFLVGKRFLSLFFACLLTKDLTVLSTNLLYLRHFIG